MPKPFASLVPAAIMALTVVACTKKEPPAPEPAAPRVDYAKQMDEELNAYSKKLAADQHAKDSRGSTVSSNSSTYSATSGNYSRSPRARSGAQDDLARALSEVISKNTFMSEVERGCSATASASDVTDAIRKWRVKNSSVLTRANNLLTTSLDGDTRQQVESLSRGAQESSIATQLGRSPNAAGMCSATARDIRNGSHDLVGRSAETVLNRS